MANIAAQSASQGLTGPQLMQQAMLGGGGIIGSAAQQAQTLAQQQLANQGITPLGQAQSSVTQDPNNLSSTGFGGVVTQANNMMNPSTIEEATGNAPNNTITAGMAVGDAPVATAGNFNPQTQFAAARIFGPQKFKRKPLINL